MKHTRKVVVAVLVGLAAVGSLFAYDGRRDRWPPPSPPSASAAAETVTVSGPLELVNGRIAVVEAGKTYYADQLMYLVGFIEGLREGAQVTLKGSAGRYPSGTDSYRLWITTMTLNGKVYDNLDGGMGPRHMTERPIPPRWGPS